MEATKKRAAARMEALKRAAGLIPETPAKENRFQEIQKAENLENPNGTDGVLVNPDPEGVDDHINEDNPPDDLEPEPKV